MKRLLFLVVMLLALWFEACYSQELSGLSKQKPFAIHGNVGVGLGTYSVRGIPARQRDFTYMLSGAPSLDIYGVSFPFSVVLSDQQRSYTQPFNQYGISPSYKWATLHAGWRSLTYSPFTLAGHNFLGAGVDLTPGKLRFGFMYGRFKKAIEEDPNQPVMLAEQASYRRMGYSAKIGYGSSQSFIDLIWLNAKDNEKSINQTSGTNQLTPAENLVIGLNGRLKLFKNFDLQGEIAGSAFTRNKNSDSLVHLDLGKFSFIQNLLTLNTSTRLTSAMQYSLGYHQPNYQLRAKYKRIDPDYQSMGAYYFETDVENYTLEGSAKWLKGLLQTQGSFGLQFDDVLNEKIVQSKRTIGSIQVAFQKPNYGVDLRYSNYGITQDRGLNPLIEALRVSRTNHNLNVVTRYQISSTNLHHNFVLLGNLQSLVDLNEHTKANTETESNTINFSYQLGLIPQSLQVNTSFNYTHARFSLGDQVYWGPSLGISKALWKGKVTINSSASLQWDHSVKNSGGQLFSLLLNSSGRITKTSALNLSLNYLNNQSSNELLPSFRELRTNLTLVQSF